MSTKYKQLLALIEKIGDIIVRLKKISIPECEEAKNLLNNMIRSNQKDLFFLLFKKAEMSSYIIYDDRYFIEMNKFSKIINEIYSMYLILKHLKKKWKNILKIHFMNYFSSQITYHIIFEMNM